MLTLQQYVDFNLLLTLRQPSNGNTPGNPIDLTGASAVGCIFKGYTNPTRYPLSIAFNPDPTTGQLTVGLDATQTGFIPYGLYLIEIRVLDSQGKKIEIMQGSIQVEPGVSDVN